MRISRFNGELAFPEGKIWRSLDREAFLAAPFASGAKIAMRNEQWIHYKLQPETGIAATLLFAGNRLDKVFLQLAIPSDETQQWSVEGEMERKRLHDEWLRKELGKPPYHYNWGRIESCYDDRGCSSDIIVSYDH